MANDVTANAHITDIPWSFGALQNARDPTCVGTRLSKFPMTSGSFTWIQRARQGTLIGHDFKFRMHHAAMGERAWCRGVY
eukprot:scaffold232997_cov33-Tisochrysis_lutea.AAC.10